MEVQIRTMKMHHQAEYGLAAHWRYKEDNSEHSAFSSERVEWARWVLSWHSEILDTKLRVSPLGEHLRPPCPFPEHTDECPYSEFCGLPVRDNDPVFIIKMENDNVSFLPLELLLEVILKCGAYCSKCDEVYNLKANRIICIAYMPYH